MLAGLLLDPGPAVEIVAPVLSCISDVCRPSDVLAMQAGVWDVDGTGMQAVDDPEVDLGIRKVGVADMVQFLAGQYALLQNEPRDRMGTVVEQCGCGAVQCACYECQIMRIIVRLL